VVELVMVVMEEAVDKLKKEGNTYVFSSFF